MRHHTPRPPVAVMLKSNLSGRDFVVGDLSACGDFAAIDRAMVDQSFDVERDRLFCVGHVGVDAVTALDAKAVLRFLSQPHVFAIRGEREERLLALSARVALAGDGLAGLMAANCTAWFSAADAADRARILELLTAMPLAIQTGTETGGVTGYVHAQVPAGLSWSWFMRSLNDADGYTTDMALFGRIPGDAITNDLNATTRPLTPAVAGAETIFVGHAGATARRGQSNRPSNVHHVNGMQRAYSDFSSERRPEASTAVQNLRERLQAFVFTVMKPQRVVMR